ncbi:MAG TPA: Smr/MutS family protein [Steroidobacteraceae bacterium]|nr:Smr/MutS family protein [Steroidobacteraceae bacterium]
MSGGDDDEREQFRRAMHGVRPLPPAGRSVPARRKPPARARFSRAERASVLRESLAAPPLDLDIQPGDALQHRQSGVPETVLRRLRRGDYRIEAEIDLHGLGVVQARAQLRSFLLAAAARRLRCVRIVHGKGLRSGQRGPVLKQAVDSLLRRAALILAFTSAGMRDGGTGATLALLRADERPSS